MSVSLRNKHIWSDRRLFLYSVGLTAALPLTYLHPMYAVLSVLTWVFISYYLFDFLSRMLFAKRFHPPTRFVSEWDWTRRASDWLSFVPFLMVFVCLLLAFGEIGDCTGERNVWKRGWEICESKED